jgi:hypothetical protein
VGIAWGIQNGECLNLKGSGDHDRHTESMLDKTVRISGIVRGGITRFTDQHGGRWGR